jgi:hypothetical protein
MPRRNFIIVCVERSKDRVKAIGGFYEDDETWHDYAEDEVLKQMADGITSFFTEDPEGNFAPVHSVKGHAGGYYIRTSPDDSLSDNLDHLGACGGFAERVKFSVGKKRVLRRFQNSVAGLE